MESKVIFRSGQDLDPDDFNNLQDFAQGAMDHVVGDALTAGRAYAGFTASVAPASATRATIAAGRLYAAGIVYARDTSIDFDFTTSLPITGKKNVLVLVSGAIQDTDETPREFLIDEATMAAQAQVVAMRNARVANVNTITGAEAPSPADPAYDAAYLAVARIVLAPTGVESCTMLTDNALPSLAGLAEQASELQAEIDADRSKITAIDSNVASLKEQASGGIASDAYSKLLTRVATIEAKFGVPAAAVSSRADYFLDGTLSDTADGAYASQVQEGIRFPKGTHNTSALQILNALNTSVKINNGLVLPDYYPLRRWSTGSPDNPSLQVSTYSFGNHSFRRKGMARTRIRYGDQFSVGVNASMWGGASTAYRQQTFARGNEVFATDDNGLPGKKWARSASFWHDGADDPYWTSLTQNQVVAGTQVAEVFLLANDMWLDSVGLSFSALANEGDVTIVLCETVQGKPDPTKALSITNVPRASLSTTTSSAPTDREIIIPVQPCFLQGGTRYALVLVTAADHRLRLAYRTPGWTQFGTLFTWVNDAWQQEPPSREFFFTVYAAYFSGARVEVDLQPLQLAGGIGAIDINIDAVVPASCQLDFMVQINGAWLALDKTQGILSAGGSLPPLLPLKAVFTGTRDVAPGFALANSVCDVSVPATSLTHVSTPMNLAAASSQIRVITHLEAFNAAHHSCATTLLTGAGYTTSVVPSSVVDTVNADGSIDRTSVFNLGAGVTSFKRKTVGTTDNALTTFQVSSCKDYAQ